MPLVLALVLLAACAFGVSWFLRANPSGLARVARFVMLGVGAVGVGAMLLFGMRFLPSLMPELFALAGIVMTALIARAVRQRPSGGFSTPGSGKRTEVRTAFLRAWIDHGTGEVGGAVLAGAFSGRTLDSLSDADLLALHRECSADGDSLRVVEAYMDRRLGPAWRTAHREPPPRSARGNDMSREEALDVLGLSEGATQEEITAAHRRLIRRMHPDVGGSADIAARINRAKDVLLGH